MELHEYPRPANDTGIGIHWAVGYASAIGMSKIREFWIPEMKAMGIKWVKIFNHDGALNFAELLLAEGFMPIVRIYRPSPNPSTLDIKETVHLDAYVRAGVRYFEFNHEPDKDSEWKGGRVPANGLELVADNTIANLEIILERGGMPAVPAVSCESRWDLVGKIVAKGRKDLFNGPVWQAIHNYSRNRPLDYPYDIGNQEGAAYTQRFYQAVADERWGEDTWRGRSLADVNRLRLDRCNPGATIMDDAVCWLAYEYFDARNRRHLGHSIPILSTENGYLVGEDVDPRYPATTPDLHMAQTLEACRIMMGTSHRFKAAPDYYFCTAFWLMGNTVLGSSSPWWEHHAWYSERWPGGVLPIAPALKAEPKVVRRWQSAGLVGESVTLHGMVMHADEHRTLILEKGGLEITRVTLDANSRYVIADLSPGNYTLSVEGTAAEQAISLTPGQGEAILNLDLGEPAPRAGGSALGGQVAGGAGAIIVLLRAHDGEEWVTMAHDDGSFRFVGLPPGAYNVRVYNEGSSVEGIQLDGKNQYEVALAVAGWGYTIHADEDADKIGAIRCAVGGHKNLAVRAHTGDWSSEPVYTGSAPDYGEFACEITPLEADHYIVSVDGLTDQEGKTIQLEARVYVDKKKTPFVKFVYTDLAVAATTHYSSIIGRVIGGVTIGRPIHVALIDEQARRREQPVDGEGAFTFYGLGPGLYSVEATDYSDVVRQTDIALDGKNQVAIELALPIEPTVGDQESPVGQSVITGSVPDAAGRMARLVDTVGNEFKQVVDSDNCFRFEGLSAGVYTLTVEGGYEQVDLQVDGHSGLEVELMALTSVWEAKVSLAGSMPGYSVVRVEVEGKRDLPVFIWKEDWEGMMRRTGSKPEYGGYTAEFSPLGPGHYMVEPEGLGVWADVELTGLEVVWIDFHERPLPKEPNVVRSIDGFAHASSPEPGLIPPAINAPEESPPAPSNEPREPEAAATAHYLFVGTTLESLEEFISLLRFVARVQPVIGQNLEDAGQAEQVTIVGNADIVGLDIEEYLQAQGVQVKRIFAP